MTDINQKMKELGSWYHRIELEPGLHTPGTRNQQLTFNLYRDRNLLPDDLTGARVLDLGANAAGLSIEFAKRGAYVVAVEQSPTYCKQAEFVISYLGLAQHIEIVCCDLFNILNLGTFDIVIYVGLSYHIRYPQLALDMISHVCTGRLLASSQTISGDGLILKNRASGHAKNRRPGELYGWEPTETLFMDMLLLAGFKNVMLLSTSPHQGEEAPHNILGNRSYFSAQADRVTPLPFISKKIDTKPHNSFIHKS